jgi:hypothetical protein
LKKGAEAPVLLVHGPEELLTVCEALLLIAPLEVIGQAAIAHITDGRWLVGAFANVGIHASLPASGSTSESGRMRRLHAVWAGADGGLVDTYSAMPQLPPGARLDAASPA